MTIALPADFETYTRRLFGDNLYHLFADAFSEEPPVSIRLNPFKKGKNVAGEPVPWCKNGYWTDKRENFTLDPLFHAGCYYVQEAGSMFLDKVLRQHVADPATMLDLCAAPGGKATLARAALPPGSTLYCNETDRRRANILIENIQKQGHRDVVVTGNSAKAYREADIMFDVILADVPCSGEGMFRKDARAIQEWSVANAVKCAGLQRSIVRDIWPCLKKDGLLVYSTCTFNTRENEENVRWIAEELGAEPVSVDTEKEWRITGSLLENFPEPVYRFIPGVTRSEGLFMAVLRKTGEETAMKRKRAPALHVLYDGRDGQTRRDKKTGAPTQGEALLYDLPEGRYAKAELSLDEALRYLRRETITLRKSVPTGYVIVCYNGHALGFVKNIGTRANNLYPQEWRIRNK